MATADGNARTMNPETDAPLTVGAPVYYSVVEQGAPVIHGPR